MRSIGWTYRAEASYRAGSTGANDVTALMVGGDIGIKLSGKATLALWGDLLSGDDDEILA